MVKCLWDELSKAEELVKISSYLNVAKEGVDFTIFYDILGVRLGVVLLMEGKVIAYFSYQLKPL